MTATQPPIPSGDDRHRSRIRIRDFLASIYGDAELSEQASMALWSTTPRPDGQNLKHPTEWFTDLDEAADRVLVLMPHRSVYYGVGLHSRELVEGAVRARLSGESEGKIESAIKYARGSKSSVTGMPGLWLDIDFGVEGHDQANLPPDRNTAREIVDAMPKPPSLVVDTGGGFHAYWLFREVWDLETVEERQEAEAHSYGWWKTARDIASDLGGWRVDSTWDLARVLRPAGALNPKHNRFEVQPILQSDARYNPSDFEMWSERPSRRGPVRDLGDHVDPQATCDEGLLETMLELDVQFARSWHRRRGNEFSSASEYEQSLASIAWANGWPEGQILAMLIQFRREKYNEGPKHASYYANTLALARGDSEAADAVEALDAIVLESNSKPSVDAPVASVDTPEADEASDGAEAGGEAEAEAPAQEAPKEDPEQRAEVFNMAAAALKGSSSHAIVIEDFVKILPAGPSERPLFEMTINSRTVTLGSAPDVMNHGRVRQAILETTSVVVPKMKSARWERILQALMLHVREIEPVNGQEQMRGYILGMLRAQRPVWHEGISPISPSTAYFYRMGRRVEILTSLEQVRLWLNGLGIRMAPRELGRTMIAAGGEKVRRTFHHLDEESGERREDRITLWRLPFIKGSIRVTPEPEELRPAEGSEQAQE